MWASVFRSLCVKWIKKKRKKPSYMPYWHCCGMCFTVIDGFLTWQSCFLFPGGYRSNRRLPDLTSKKRVRAVIFMMNINSLAPGRSEYNSKSVIFNLVLLIGVFRSYDNALWWMPRDLTDDKSTLVQVMAWCRQATSHYLSQCWLSTLSPYGVARPQWVEVTCKSHVLVNASVTSHSRAPHGLFPGCFEQKSYVRPVRRRTNFASPYGARRVLMHAL